MCISSTKLFKRIMKLSWSYKLFFIINAQIGKRKWLDELMLFCAHVLIYLIVLLSLSWAVTILFDAGPDLFLRYIKLLLTTLVFTILTSWIIALIFQKARPVRELPNVLQLFEPYQTWKAFPSDHALISFVVAEITWLVGAPVWFGIILVLLALLVGFSRVYAGVHYPRDIVGGIILATIFSFLSFWLVENISGPVYDVFKLLFV